MREPQFDRLRSEVGDAVRQPDFSTVRSRAGQVRRRRAITSGAVFLATVVTVTGLGFAVRSVPNERGLADAAPAASGGPEDVWPRMTSVTNAGTNLYGVFTRCRACDAELYTSPDGGESWQHRTMPPAPSGATSPRTASLVALAPRLVVWREQRNLSMEEALTAGSPANTESPAAGPGSPAVRPWITRDGGMSWEQATIDTQPVVAVPEGTRPVDCALLKVSTCTIGVIDPATGRFAPLAGQPTGINVQQRWTDEITVPPDGRLWVPGLDPVTNLPAVATSSDAGRSWNTHVFTGAVAAVPRRDGTTPTMYLPKVAAGTGKAAYALTYRADNVFDAHYTTDGGMTWRAGDTIRDDALLSAGFVTADGSHIVTTGIGPVTTGTGFVAGRGTGRYTPVALSGYPEDVTNVPTLTLTQVASRQAAEPYLVNSVTGPYLSEDGRTWRRVRLP